MEVILGLILIGVIGIVYLRLKDSGDGGTPSPTPTSTSAPTPTPSNPPDVTPTPSPSEGSLTLLGPSSVGGMQICYGDPVGVSTQNVIYTASGGMGPYTISIGKVDGSDKIQSVFVEKTDESETYIFETKGPIDCGESLTATFRVVATDANGRSDFIDVEVNLSAQQ